MDIHHLLPKLPTPFFLFDKETLKQEVYSLKKAFITHWNNYSIGYSVKTNSFPPLANYLKTLNIDAEVVSEDEYDLALAVGYEAKNIICNGPVKSKSWVRRILDSEGLLNIDSKREIGYIIDFAKEKPDTKIHVGVRVNLDLESVFPGESNAGERGSRFGFSFENGELENAITQLRSHSNIFITGLHLHISTKTRRIEIYRWLTRQFAKIVEQYQLKDISYFDIGGSFFGGIPTKPGWNDYLSAIGEELALLHYTPDNLRLIIEPGVSLLAGCFRYYTRVIDVKQTPRRNIILLDGSRIHVDPLMHKTSYFYQIERTHDSDQNGLNKNVCQTLAGFTCLENDLFFELKDSVLLQEGDIVRFDKVGAYTLTFSPLFISFFPAVYAFSESGNIECLRPKWSVNEFIQLSKISL